MRPASHIPLAEMTMAGWPSLSMAFESSVLET